MNDPPDIHHYTGEKQTSLLLRIGLGDGEPDIAYVTRLLFHTMIPHTSKDAREWVRKNGRIEVYIQAGPGMGLPYGSYPRLVFVWLVNEAYRTKSRHLVLGDSLSHFMRQLGLIPSGGRWGSIRQLREQMQRLLSARVSAMIDVKEQGRRGRGMKSMLVADQWELWWDPKNPNQIAIWNSAVVLGERFFQTVIDRPFPLDMRILKAVKRSPLGIDLYTWLTYRVSYMKEPTLISWSQLHAQFGSDYERVKNFTQKAKRELEKIQKAWPELRYETPRGRLKLLPSRPSIERVT